MGVMGRRERGFTIVEVMTVLTIVGILAAIAIPAYQDFATRARVAEAIAFARPVQVAVTLFYSSNFSLPSSNEEADLGAPASMNSSVVESVEILESGAIEVRLRHPALSGHKLTFTPSGGSTVTWTCSSTLPDQFVPATCRTP